MRGSPLSARSTEPVVRMMDCWLAMVTGAEYRVPVSAAE
jgi:hypothetical protein